MIKIIDYKKAVKILNERGVCCPYCEKVLHLDINFTLLEVEEKN